MKRIVLAIVFLLLAAPAFGQGWQEARMNLGIVGSNVVAAGGGGPSYGVGNLLSERFSSAYDNAGWSETTEGDGAVNESASTVSGTGFVGNHLTVSGSSDWQGYTSIDIGAQSAVYFRFYYQMNSESWGDGDTEMIFTLGPNGSNIGNKTYLYITADQASGQLRLTGQYDDGNVLGTYNISTGTIYKIEGKITDDGDSGTVEWKVNGEVQGTRTEYATYGTVAVQDIHIGVSYNAAASNHSFDTLDISSTGYLTDTE